MKNKCAVRIALLSLLMTALMLNVGAVAYNPSELTWTSLLSPDTVCSWTSPIHNVYAGNNISGGGTNCATPGLQIIDRGFAYWKFVNITPAASLAFNCTTVGGPGAAGNGRPLLWRVFGNWSNETMTYNNQPAYCEGETCWNVIGGLQSNLGDSLRNASTANNIQWDITSVYGFGMPLDEIYLFFADENTNSLSYYNLADCFLKAEGLFELSDVTVFAYDNYAAISGLEVQVCEPDYINCATKFTDSNGEAEFDLPFGSYRIDAEYIIDVDTILTHSESFTVDELNESVVIHFDTTGPGSIGGFVYWPNGTAAPNAIVIVNGTDDYTTVTALNGEFLISPIVKGNYNIQAFKAGLSSEVSSFSCTGDDSINLNLRGGRFSFAGKVFRYGVGVEASSIRLWKPANASYQYSTVSDATGFFNITNVDEGVYHARAYKCYPEGCIWKDVIDIVIDDNEYWTIALGTVFPRVILNVTAFDDTGSGIQDVFVSLLDCDYATYPNMDACYQTGACACNTLAQFYTDGSGTVIINYDLGLWPQHILVVGEKDEYTTETAEIFVEGNYTVVPLRMTQVIQSNVNVKAYDYFTGIDLENVYVKVRLTNQYGYWNEVLFTDAGGWANFTLDAHVTQMQIDLMRRENYSDYSDAYPVIVYGYRIKREIGMFTGEIPEVNATNSRNVTGYVTDENSVALPYLEMRLKCSYASRSDSFSEWTGTNGYYEFIGIREGGQCRLDTASVSGRYINEYETFILDSNKQYNFSLVKADETYTVSGSVRVFYPEINTYISLAHARIGYTCLDCQDIIGDSVYSDLSGYYTIDGLPEGNYMFMVEHVEYTPYNTTRYIGLDTQLNFELVRTSTIFTVRGTVKLRNDGGDLEPVSATVYVYHQGSLVRTVQTSGTVLGVFNVRLDKATYEFEADNGNIRSGKVSRLVDRNIAENELTLVLSSLLDEYSSELDNMLRFILDFVPLFRLMLFILFLNAFMVIVGVASYAFVEPKRR